MQFTIEGDFIKLLIPVLSIAPDRTQYKPYSPEYACDGLFVEVVIPSSVIRFAENDGVALTPAGLAMVIDILASAIDDMHDNFRSRSRMMS